MLALFKTILLYLLFKDHTRSYKSLRILLNFYLFTLWRLIQIIDVKKPADLGLAGPVWKELFIFLFFKGLFEFMSPHFGIWNILINLFCLIWIIKKVTVLSVPWGTE